MNIKAQKHVAIMDVHNSTAYFEAHFQPTGFAESPVNVSVETVSHSSAPKAKSQSIKLHILKPYIKQLALTL